MEVCPKEIDIPAKAIEKMRAIAVKTRLGPLPKQKEYITRAVTSGRSIEKTGISLLEMIQTARVEEPKDTIGYFPGCLTDYRLQNVGKALIDVLTKNNMEVIIPREFVCCGSPLIRAGMIDEAKEKLVSKNIMILEGLNTIIVTACPGCAMTIKIDY